jgi:hypothetical protein
LLRRTGRRLILAQGLPLHAAATARDPAQAKRKAYRGLFEHELKSAFAPCGDRAPTSRVPTPPQKREGVYCQRHLWKRAARFLRGPFLNFIFIFEGSSVVSHRGRTAWPAIVSKQKNAHEAQDSHRNHRYGFHDRARPNHGAAERRNGEQRPRIRCSRCVDVTAMCQLRMRN